MIENKFGIYIDPTWQDPAKKGSPVAYVAGVREALTNILRSKGGQILASSLRYYKKDTLIGPYEGGGCHAQEWWWGNSPADHLSAVHFTPDTRESSPCAKLVREKLAAVLPHEVLFHELVHSFRTVSGQMKNWRLRSPLVGYQWREEFIAILVTNIFISDVTNSYKTRLGRDHSSNAALDPELADSYRYFSLGTQAYNLIVGFCDENRGFTHALAQVHAKFNPIAAYLRHPRKAFEIAAQGDVEAAWHTVAPFNYMQDDATKNWVRITPYQGPPSKGGS